jgi:hypothetical protein
MWMLNYTLLCVFFGFSPIIIGFLRANKHKCAIYNVLICNNLEKCG